MERRKFFQFIGLGAAAAAVGGRAVAATIIPNDGKADVVKKIESNDSKVTIVAEYDGEIPPPIVSQYGDIMIGPRVVPGTSKQVKADLTVGPDGEMYLRTNGKWRKIVTE